jgi:hypothetical protein
LVYSKSHLYLFRTPLLTPAWFNFNGSECTLFGLLAEVATLSLASFVVYFKLGETFMKGIFKSRLVLTCVALVLLVGALAVALLSNTHSHPALAYGKANWQIAFSGTGTAPGTGQGFGFWGWCDLGGAAATSNTGNTGDCEFSQYVHPQSSGVTCEVSIDITSWDGTGPTFLITGTATAHPISATAFCLSIFPGSANFTNVDSMIPSAPGHYNLGALGPGLRGSLQIQVVKIP